MTVMVCLDLCQRLMQLVFMIYGPLLLRAFLGHCNLYVNTCFLSSHMPGGQVVIIHYSLCMNIIM